MIKNMGKTDRIGRVLLAALVAILYIAGQITGTTAIILGTVAAIFIITSVVGICPLYMPCKLKTTGKEKASQ
jgi:hypothetical protein